MKHVIFFFLTLAIYIGAFEICKRIFGDGDLAIVVGGLVGSVCFYWMVSKLKDD